MKRIQNFIRTGIFMAVLISSAGVTLYAADAAAPDAALVAKGRDLFNNKEGLGVKFACIMCHKNDKAVKKALVEKLGDKLPATINKYITTRAKGKALAVDSEEMKALQAYILYEHAK